jgi:hypothetical protein
MKAIWGLDYDYRTDKCYKRPMCPECDAPILKDGDEYKCISCGQPAEVEPFMIVWIENRNETKVTMEDCHQFNLPDGGKIGCGGKACVETHYVRNPVTLEWQTAWGQCSKCGKRFIV